MKRNLQDYLNTWDYDYEEDDFDRFERVKKKAKKVFTNRSTTGKTEYDYEEDPYEPR